MRIVRFCSVVACLLCIFTCAKSDYDIQLDKYEKLVLDFENKVNTNSITWQNIDAMKNQVEKMSVDLNNQKEKMNSVQKGRLFVLSGRLAVSLTRATAHVYEEKLKNIDATLNKAKESLKQFQTK